MRDRKVLAEKRLVKKKKMDPQSDAYKSYVESIKEEACLYITRKFPSVPARSPSSGFRHAIQAVVDNALKVMEVQAPLLTRESQEYVYREIYKRRDIEIARRQTEWMWNAKREEARKIQRTKKWQLSVARAQYRERERLNQERNRDLQQQGQQEHKQKEQARRQVRDPQKTCCPNKLLGADPGTEQGVKVWVTKCKICHRKEYGQFGFDQNKKREGLYFRGLWFSEIDPETGTGITFDKECIDLTYFLM